MGHPRAAAPVVENEKYMPHGGTLNPQKPKKKKKKKPQRGVGSDIQVAGGFETPGHLLTIHKKVSVRN